MTRRTLHRTAASAYARTFSQLWDKGRIGASGNFDTAPDAGVRPWFCPGRGPELSHRIAKRIGAARRRVRIASPLLTSGPVLAAIDETDVDLAGVCDLTQVQQVFRQWEAEGRAHWKVPLLRQALTRFTGKRSTPWSHGTVHDFMHAKVTVADDVVFLGSFNLSRSGEMNAENVLEIADPALAERLAAWIDALRALPGAGVGFRAGMASASAVEAYDEARRPDGTPRPGYAPVLAALEGRDLGALGRDVRAGLAARGVSFNSIDGDAAFNLDPVPRVFTAEEWEPLEAGIAQRTRALNAFIADVYGPRRVVAEGVVEARVIEGAGNYEPAMQGARMPHDQWVGIAGLDIVRGTDGRFAVLEDNCLTPSGFGYAMAARQALLEHVAAAADPPPRPLEGMTELLSSTLRAVSPVDREPVIVVLTDGPENSAHWEHERAAELLGVALVECDDLTVEDDRVRHAGRTVDVIYRRTNADTLDTRIGRLLLGPLRAGTLGIVNAYGCGVSDDKLVHAYVEDLVRFYLREEPLLPSVETLDLGRPEVLERALDTLEELVVKPRTGYGGIGVVICPHAERADVETLREKIREAPAEFIAQPMVALSTHPTVIQGRLEPRHIDLRPYPFLQGAGEARVLPGGLSRVALDEGALVVNSTQNGGAKDTWIVG